MYVTETWATNEEMQNRMGDESCEDGNMAAAGEEREQREPRRKQRDLVTEDLSERKVD